MTETPRQLVIRFCIGAVSLFVGLYFRDFLRANVNIHMLIMGFSIFLFLALWFIWRKVAGGFWLALACGVTLVLMFYTVVLIDQFTGSTNLGVMVSFAVAYGMAVLGQRTGLLKNFDFGSKAAPGGGSHGDPDNS